MASDAITDLAHGADVLFRHRRFHTRDLGFDFLQ